MPRNPLKPEVWSRTLVAKTCTRCGELKDASHYRRKDKEGNWHSWCRACRNVQTPEQLARIYARKRARKALRPDQKRLAETIKNQAAFLPPHMRNEFVHDEFREHRIPLTAA